MERSFVARANSQMEEDSLAFDTDGLADPRLQMSSCSHENISFRDLITQQHRQNIGEIFKSLIVPDSPPPDRRSWNKNINIRDLVSLMKVIYPSVLTDEDIEGLIKIILTSHPIYNKPLQRGGDRRMCAVRLNVSAPYLVPPEYLELFTRANKISGEFTSNASYRDGDSDESCDVYDCSSLTTFAELSEHLHSCRRIGNSVQLSSKACGSLSFQTGQFFVACEYEEFKKSFFRDLLFVQELRKENRGSISATRRVYSVYGNSGTGMLYSNYFRRSEDSVPLCVSLLFHRLAASGYPVSCNTCAMIAAYPAMSEDDIKAAIQCKSDLFTAMDWHSDSNNYLGSATDIEVWTISGFLDPVDLNSVVTVDGWKFLVRTKGDTSFNWLPIPDNHLLIQPKGMQDTHQHAVQGQLSEKIRFVITIREVVKDIFANEIKKVRCREGTGHALAEWLANDDLRCSWTQPSKPQTHAAVRDLEPRDVLSILYPYARELDALSKYLVDYDACYCWSCNSLLQKCSHDCRVRNPVVFGRRHSFVIGDTYNRESLVTKSFNGVLKMEESFRCDAKGCTSIFLTTSYPGNDWSRWRDGVIFVGGAGGRKAGKKRKVNDQLVAEYTHVKPQVSKKNLALLHNLHYKIPIDVVVQFDDISFTYLGSWYVKEAKLCAGSEATNGFSFYQFELVSRQVFWDYMTSIKFEFGFILNPNLEKFLRFYVGCHIVDDQLNEDGMRAASTLAPTVEATALVSVLSKNFADLCLLFNIEAEVTVVGRIVAALNRLIL